MKAKIMIPALIVAAGLATAGGLAFAKRTGGMENDAVADLARARISLNQAVTAAETQAGGKAPPKPSSKVSEGPSSSTSRWSPATTRWST